MHEQIRHCVRPVRIFTKKVFYKMTRLQPGQTAPDFRSTTQDGEPLTLADLRGQRVILYFYPKDNTSGCTLEAQSLRDGKEELARQGFRIVGVAPTAKSRTRTSARNTD